MSILQQAVPFDASCTTGLDPATLLVTDTVKMAIGPGHDQEWAYFEYELDDVAKLRDLARRPDAVTTLEIETGGDVARSTRMNDFLRPKFHLGHELRAAASVDGATWGAMCLYRAEGSRGFSPAEVEFVGSATESIALGIRMGLLAGAVSGPTSHHGPAVLIVGADDDLEQVSAGAESWLAEAWGDDAHTWGPLPVHLLTLVSAARAFARGTFPTTPRLRIRSRSGEWLVAHASPLAARDGRGTSVVVTIEEARPPEIVPLVVAAFGLSPREQEVVGLVLRGVDTAHIAKALHMSAYTVQDHLKSTFEKAGVRSRRELTSKVFFDQYASRLGDPVGPDGWFARDASNAASAQP